MKRVILIATILVLILFGMVTLFMSSSVIFDLFGIREREGNYVLFIVVVNFICGLIYLLSSYGLAMKKQWTTYLMIFSVTLLILAFIGLWVYINSGGAYEMKTIWAMLFRISISSLLASVCWYLAPRKSATNL